MAAVQPTPAHAGADEAGSGTGDLAAEVAALGQLDAAALRRRWRALVGGAMPADLGRPLTLRVLAYKLQAQRLGDLDRASLRALAALAGPTSGTGGDADADSDGNSASRNARPPTGEISGAAGAVPAEQRTRPAPARTARPGTVLVREHGGVPHRVTVLGDGFSWNGRSFDSLSQVAFAITGTKWNGPRFFGLRDKADAASAVGTVTARQAARAAPALRGVPRRSRS